MYMCQMIMSYILNMIKLISKTNQIKQPFHKVSHSLDWYTPFMTPSSLYPTSFHIILHALVAPNHTDSLSLTNIQNFAHIASVSMFSLHFSSHQTFLILQAATQVECLSTSLINYVYIHTIPDIRLFNSRAYHNI